MKIAKKSLSVTLTGFSVFCIAFASISTPAYANFEGYATNCVDGQGKSSSNSGVSMNISGVGGFWTQKGSPAYKIAKGIFDFLTKKVGFSGAGAAGAVAIANRESTFNPKAFNPGGYVAGLFQWSLDGSPNANLGGKGRIGSGGYISGDGKRGLNFENEMKLTQYELNHNYSKVKSLVGRATNPEKAADDWSVSYEGVSASDGQTKTDQIHADARKAYEMFGGANISANSALLGGTQAAEAGVAKQASKNPCNRIEPSANNNIVRVAKSLLGYFHYLQVHGESYIGSVEHPDKDGHTDCSGFVWLVLAKAGYRVPANMQWFTRTMQDDAQGSHHWLKEISKDEARPGDVVIVNVASGSGDDGHTAILESKWKGDNTKVIQMTDNGKGVSEGTFRYSFYSLLQEGGRPVIARAIKK